ncbi:zinc finger protein 626-like [Agrilus planipennis]|uniref:Zinc finger protein 626-like n=1 Tax=Agrilus planipennis TaxID=224129 RepID=A0A1W4W2Q2_AGRPL|nr:zinc finger protein 626-like [Agrilus planipennis]
MDRLSAESSESTKNHKYRETKQLKHDSRVHVKFDYVVKTKPFSPNEYPCKHLLCELCGKSYIRYNAFMRHKLAHDIDDKTNRTCQICNKTFSNVYNYQVHTVIHQGCKSYKCGVCSKAFAHEYYLNRHMKGHQEQALFPGETSGKSYASNVGLEDDTFNALVSDKRRSRKLHKCSKCGKIFKYRSRLKTHLKVHLKSSPAGKTKVPNGVDETDERVVILFDENGLEVDEKLCLIDETFDFFDEGSSDTEKKPDIFTEEEQIVVKNEEEPIDIKPFEFSTVL